MLLFINYCLLTYGGSAQLIVAMECGLPSQIDEKLSVPGALRPLSADDLEEMRRTTVLEELRPVLAEAV